MDDSKTGRAKSSRRPSACCDGKKAWTGQEVNKVVAKDLHEATEEPQGEQNHRVLDPKNVQNHPTLMEKRLPRINHILAVVVQKDVARTGGCHVSRREEAKRAASMVHSIEERGHEMWWS